MQRHTNRSALTFTPRERAGYRLAAQGLDSTGWDTPVEAVAAFGLMQGQDFSSVYRSVALRTRGGDDGLRCPLVDASLNAGELVRGYPMRSTVFISHREDMRWISQLCVKPTQHQDIDPIRQYLHECAEPITRAEFKESVEKHLPDSIPYRVLRQLLEENIVVYQGTDQKIALFPEDENSPGLEAKFNGDRLAAATELMARYFRTHGPATIVDFAWWTKLPMKLIRQAAQYLPNDVAVNESGEYFVPDLEMKSRSVHLLGAFDEYILGYKDRLFAMTPETHAVVVPRNMGIFRKTVVVDGQVRGMWTKQGVENLSIPQYAQARVRRLHARAVS